MKVIFLQVASRNPYYETRGRFSKKYAHLHFIYEPKGFLYFLTGQNFNQLTCPLDAKIVKHIPAGCDYYCNIPCFFDSRIHYCSLDKHPCDADVLNSVNQPGKFKKFLNRIFRKKAPADALPAPVVTEATSSNADSSPAVASTASPPHAVSTPAS